MTNATYVEEIEHIKESIREDMLNGVNTLIEMSNKDIAAGEVENGQRLREKAFGLEKIYADHVTVLFNATDKGQLLDLAMAILAHSKIVERPQSSVALAVNYITRLL